MAEKNLIQQAGLEMVAIVVSVLLALYLNNWWMDRQTETGHKKTLTLIAAELDANRAELEDAIKYYSDVSPKITAVLVDGVTTEEAQEIMTWCCELMSSGSGRTAHEMAVITGLYAALDPGVAAAIIAPFVGQEDLKDISSALTFGLVTITDLNDPEEFFGRYYIFAMSITPSLQELLEVTNVAIAAVDELG